MGELSAIDQAVFVIYLLVVVGLALLSARGQQDNEDYFIGGRRMNWLVVGLSLFATSFSAISFLGLPQRGAFQDFSFYLTILCIPLLITPILWFLFVPLFVRLRVSSGYEYLRLRFSPTVQRLGSLLYAGYAIGWMGAMLYGVVLTLHAVLGLTDTQYYWALIGLGLFATAYTAVGGLKAVIWTDVLQALALGTGAIVVLWLAIGGIQGGFGKFLEIAGEHDKFRLVHLDSDPLAPANFTEPNTLYTAIALALFMYLPGYAATQNMIQRYVCTGSLRGGRGVVLTSAVVNALLGFVFLLVGVAMFAFYTQPGGPGLPGVGEGGPLSAEDQILPYFVATEAPGYGLAGVILAGLFAAAMSTLDSGLNGVTSVIVYDWLAGRRPGLLVSRALTVALGLLVIAAAVFVPYLAPNVIDMIASIAGLFLGALLAIFLLGMFVPRANAPGALVGLTGGAVCLIIGLTLMDIPAWWLGALTIVPTFFIGLAGSFLFAPPSADALVGTVYRRYHKPLRDEEIDE